jgi:hypothetical protein
MRSAALTPNVAAHGKNTTSKGEPLAGCRDRVALPPLGPIRRLPPGICIDRQAAFRARCREAGHERVSPTALRCTSDDPWAFVLRHR